jgi:uncharacterized protein with PIN domain
MAFPSYKKYKLCINIEKHEDRMIKKFDKILEKDVHRCTECNNILRITPRAAKHRERVYIE